MGAPSSSSIWRIKFALENRLAELSFRFTLIAAFIAGALMLWLPLQIGGVHGYQTPALILSLAWIAFLALAFAHYGRLSGWLLLASGPALFWLIVVGGALICDGGGCG